MAMGHVHLPMYALHVHVPTMCLENVFQKQELTGRQNYGHSKFKLSLLLTYNDDLFMYCVNAGKICDSIIYHLLHFNNFRYYSILHMI